MSDYKRSRTEITIETHRVTTIRTRGVSRAVVHCDRCGQEVAPIDDTKAMTIIDDSSKMIVEAGSKAQKGEGQ